MMASIASILRSSVDSLTAELIQNRSEVRELRAEVRELRTAAHNSRNSVQALSTASTESTASILAAVGALNNRVEQALAANVGGEGENPPIFADPHHQNEANGGIPAPPAAAAAMEITNEGCSSSKMLLHPSYRNQGTSGGEGQKI